MINPPTPAAKMHSFEGLRVGSYYTQ